MDRQILATASGGTFRNPGACAVSVERRGSAMGHRSFLCLFEPVAVVALVHAASAFAGYGAVAYDQEARKPGFAWDEPSQERVNEAAKRDCARTPARFGSGWGVCCLRDPRRRTGMGRGSSQIGRCGQVRCAEELLESTLATNASSATASATDERSQTNP